MTNTDKNFIEGWEQVKAKGRAHYALLRGPMQGVFIVAFITALKLRELSFSEAFLTPKFLFSLVLYAFLFFVIYYTVMWWFNEYLYRKKLEKG